MENFDETEISWATVLFQVYLSTDFIVRITVSVLDREQDAAASAGFIPSHMQTQKHTMRICGSPVCLCVLDEIR